MTTEPPAAGGWQPPAGEYPPPQPPGGGHPPESKPFPAAYPPPAPGAAGAPSAAGAPVAPVAVHAQAAGSPGHDANPPLPDPPAARPEGLLPEPPPDLQPALQWGDPTPAPAPPPRQGPPPPFSRLAIAAAALGVLVAGGGLALILGIVAFFRVRRTGKRGQGLALTAMVLTVLWVAFGVALYIGVFSKPPSRDGDGKIVRKIEVPLSLLRVGDCLEKFSATTEVRDVTAVPCTTTHNAEVFHTIDLAGTEYPGDTTVKQQSNTGCVDASKTAIKPADLPNLKVAVFRPFASSWQAGNHRTTCVAVQNSGTITRSVRK